MVDLRVDKKKRSLGFLVIALLSGLHSYALEIIYWTGILEG